MVTYYNQLHLSKMRVLGKHMVTILVTYSGTFSKLMITTTIEYDNNLSQQIINVYLVTTLVIYFNNFVYL